MARDEAPPFARGETWYNGGPIDLADPLGLGGVNYEGKEFTFEPNSQDNFTGSYSNASIDPSGRPIRVKVVRNRSGVNLKPARVGHYEAAAGTTATPYQTGLDGYATDPSQRPAGVIDEFLPAAGVPPSDLFYIVTRGPSQLTTGATTSPVVVVGDRIVPVAYGATAGDDLGGRFAKQDLSGATAVLGNQIQNQIGFASTAVAATTSVNTRVNVIVDLKF